MLRGALDIQLGHEIIKVFGATAPWVFMLFIAPILSLLLYALWHNVGPMIYGYFAFAAALLSFWQLKVSHTKRWPGKFLILANINFWTFILAAASQYGIWHRPVLDIFFAGGILLAIMANMRTIRGSDEESGVINWNEIDKTVGFDGKSKFKALPNIGKTVRGMIKLKDGLTAKQLMNSEDQIKSLLGLPANGLRFNPNLDDSSLVEIRLVPEDVLRHEIPWEKSAYAGKSIADGPIRIGTYEDGEPAFLHLYSKVGAKHLIISGMNGSGKSVGARIILADAMLRNDTKIFAVDVAKAEQTLGSMEKGLDLFFKDSGTANLFITRMKTVIKERAGFLGRNGFDVWTPGCGLDFIILLVEEGASFVNDSDDFTRLVETARSAGIAIILSIQRASHTNMSTDARSQFGSTLCFGVNNDMDARFVLSDEVIDRGAHPEIWKAEKPGYAYLEAYGVAAERHVTPLKTMNLEQKPLRAACEEVVQRDVDEFTRTALGNIYKEKYSQMSMPASTEETDENKAEAFVSAVKRDVDNDGEQEEEITEFDERMIYEDDSEPVLTFGDDPAVKMSPSEARAAFDRNLQRVIEEGKISFEVRDLYPVLLETGRTRPWIHAELNRRKKNGSIAHNSEDGTYQVIEPVDSRGELVEAE